MPELQLFGFQTAPYNPFGLSLRFSRADSLTCVPQHNVSAMAGCQLLDDPCAPAGMSHTFACVTPYKSYSSGVRPRPSAMAPMCAGVTWCNVQSLSRMQQVSRSPACHAHPSCMPARPAVCMQHLADPLTDCAIDMSLGTGLTVSSMSTGCRGCDARIARC
jgi:hypothetical protein